MNAQTDLIPRTTITDTCAHRARALDGMRKAIDALSVAYGQVRDIEKSAKAAHMGLGQTIGSPDHNCDAFTSIFPSRHFDPEKSLEAYRKQLDRGVWQYLLDVADIRKMMDAQAIKELQDALHDDPPEATEENVRATIQTLFGDMDMIFVRGLVNCFTKLDRRFKSHDGFKIGSRIIVDRAFSDYSGQTNYGSTWDTIADVERVMAVLDGENPEGSAQLRAKVDRDRKGHYGPQQSKTETDYFRIDGFKNCNAHLWFTRDDLVTRANKLLAGYYGEVLPDAFDEGDDDNLFNRSTAVAKDLQFYPTPAGIVDDMLRDVKLDGVKVLEPSAGQGAFALPAACQGATVTAIEVNPDHCAVLRSRAISQGVSGRIDVRNRNFLTLQPRRIFGLVLMNPPFYGTHYMDHVRHAFEFLAPGGMLIAVLPASAQVNESRKHDAFRKWAWEQNALGWAGPFRDLPPESFRESGTMIQTVTLKLCAK